MRVYRNVCCLGLSIQSLRYLEITLGWRVCVSQSETARKSRYGWQEGHSFLLLLLLFAWSVSEILTFTIWIILVLLFSFSCRFTLKGREIQLSLSFFFFYIEGPIVQKWASRYTLKIQIQALYYFYSVLVKIIIHIVKRLMQHFNTPHPKKSQISENK